MANKVSKDEFLEWCHNPVTEQLYLEVQERINQETWSLVENAGQSIYQDARSSGRVLALGEIINWQPETIMEEIDEIVMVEEDNTDA